jgi:quercetin dioxygenase-like cupin family protein
MSMNPDLSGRLISRIDHPPLLDVFGPTIEVLTADIGVAPDDAPALLRGSIPPGGVIPLHAHGEPETFYVLAGELQGLVMTADGAHWLPVRTGQIFHVPAGARHALRNVGAVPGVALLITTPVMAEFFTQVGTHLDDTTTPRPPTPEQLERFARFSDEHGFWNAPDDENARVGIDLNGGDR